MIVTFGVSAGGWLYGVLFDLYGDYQFALLSGSGGLIAAAALMLFAGWLERARAVGKRYKDNG